MLCAMSPEMKVIVEWMLGTSAGIVIMLSCAVAIQKVHEAKDAKLREEESKHERKGML